MALTRQCLLTVVGAGWLDAPLRPHPQLQPEAWIAKRRRMNLERDMLALVERESELWALRGSRLFGWPVWHDTGLGSCKSPSLRSQQQDLDIARSEKSSGFVVRVALARARCSTSANCPLCCGSGIGQGWSSCSGGKGSM